MEPEDTLAVSVMTEVFGKARLHSQVPTNSEMAISCNPDAEPGLREKSESRGEISKEKSPFRFCESKDRLFLSPSGPLVILKARSGFLPNLCLVDPENVHSRLGSAHEQPRLQLLHRLDGASLRTVRGRSSAMRYILRCYRRWTPAPRTISH
jgi:hypothetical protein